MISAIKTLLQTLVLLINKEESQINLKFAMPWMNRYTRKDGI
jgi:hypothetical protein